MSIEISTGRIGISNILAELIVSCEALVEVLRHPGDNAPGSGAGLDLCARALLRDALAALEAHPTGLAGRMYPAIDEER